MRNLVHSYVSIHTICSFFKVIIFFCSYVKVIYNNFYVLLLKSLSFSVHLLLPMQAIEQLPKGARVSLGCMHTTWFNKRLSHTAALMCYHISQRPTAWTKQAEAATTTAAKIGGIRKSTFDFSNM